MARIFTTPTKEAAAKAWLHDVLVIGGVLPKSQRTVNTVYFTDYRPVPAPDAAKICDELVNRDFADIDASIKKLASYKFYPSITEYCNEKRFSEEEIAKAIVYGAECFGLYWDDTIRTPYEITEFQKTLLGDAVYKYGRYISNIQDPKVKTTKAAKAATSHSSSGPVATSGSTSNQAKNGYKQSGPQSSKARGLLGIDGKAIPAGQPGQKVFMETDCALAIRGIVPGVKSDYYAQVRPLDPAGAAGSTNAVFVSASHSYGYGTCYFESMSEAKPFYDNLVASGKVPANVTQLEIVRTSKVEKNGYFLVDTEFGFCAISAKVLNENANELEAVEEALGSSWEKATENYTKEELDDLHSWMRKD